MQAKNELSTKSETNFYRTNKVFKMPIIISTLNLCLGLKNKKLLVKKLLEENLIDVLCMQETEVMKDIDHNELRISEYNLELELNSTKSRVGFYVSKSIHYVRRTDLEGCVLNLVIPLRAKQVGEFIEIRHKKISPTRILDVRRPLFLTAPPLMS